MRLTLRQVFFILLFLLLFLMTLYPITDPDFWWHLRTGQLILQTHAIPHTDPFSFTSIGKPWVAQEWLSEVFMFGLYRIGSYGLLIFVFSLIITGAFLLSYLRSPRKSRPYVAGFTLLLGAFATWPTWGVRPQMISLLLTSLFLYMLDRYQAEGKLKFIVPLPVIMLVWVNLHAGYILGLIIIAIYVAGSLIELLKEKLQKTKSPNALPLNSTLRLSATLGASILATFVNPNGLRILLYPFLSLTSQATQQFIQEWFSPDFHQLIWQPLAWFILAIIIAGMLRKQGISASKILLTVVFVYAALRSMRYVPLFAIVTIPILSEQIGSFFEIQPEVKKPSRQFNWLIPILMVCSVAVISICFVHVVQQQPKSEAEDFPKAAVDWIAENHPEGNIFNSYYWGGYIIWRLYPQYQVYVDGRAFDVYGDKFLYDYMDTYRAQSNWEEALDKQSVRLVLVDPKSGLASALRQSSGWEIVYEDQLSVLFDKK
ncbi:MAG TPA: hypothetical protein VF359_09120 [Anaerolineales bacterium]